ncbi:DUF4097 domain-containing protein [bacterium]|nr:DUF4097 domain-containing protein [bacterium]
MSEFRNEKRISLEEISSVVIINPIGKIQVTGWNETDLLVETVIKSDSNHIFNNENTPIVHKEDGKLIIKTMKLDKQENDGNSFSFNFGNGLDGLGKKELGLQDFVGKIVEFATNSVKKINKGVHCSLHIQLPKTMNLYVKNLNGVISISNMVSTILAKDINGPISLSSIEGQVSASTVNGPVSIEKSSICELNLKSVNGPVKCYLNKLSGPVNLKSVNGPISMTLPEDSSVNLTAKTMHVAIKISSEFTQKLRSSRKVCCVLNTGEHPVSIKTSTGAITVMTTDSQEKAGNIPPVSPVPSLSTIPTAHPTSLQTSENISPTQSANTAKNNALESPETLIDRMLTSGKITTEEAEKLRHAL